MEDPLAVAVRFALYASLGIGFGLAAFGWHGLAANDRQGWARSIRGTLIALAATALAATALGLVVLASRMFGVPLADVDGEALRTVIGLPGLGLAISLRAAALALVLLLLVVWQQSLVIIVAVQAVALATLAWGGHAAALDGWMGGMHLVSAILHLWGAGLWLGAIAAFLLLATRVARQTGEARLQLAAALSRFHRTGTLVVVVLAASGVANIALIAGLPPPAEALASPWGRLMALKLAAFLAMLGLAAANRFRLSPAFAHPLADVAPVTRSLVAELALALLIFSLVAWIGLLSPLGD